MRDTLKGGFPFGGSKDKQTGAYFYNPVTRSKEAVKWFVLKVIAAIIVIKVAFANAKHLIFSPWSSVSEIP